MMKKILFASFLILTLLCSCSKSFLEEEPLASIGTSQFYQSAKDITAAMAGMYGSFQSTMIGPNDRMIYWGEARSDNYQKNGNGGGDYNEFQLNALSAGNASADWTPLYRTINLANMIIKYMPQAVAMEKNKGLVTTAIVNNNLAQALAMRAICYFYIVRLWGDAVIRTEPYEDASIQAALPRSPKADVFSKVIIPDLTQAYGMIDKTANNTWYIGEGAICATLNDAYMWQKDYVNAKTWFLNLAKAKAPTGKVYTATSAADIQPQATWNSIFVDPTKSIETIWDLNWDFNTNACACMPGVTSTTTSTVLLVDSTLFVTWPVTNPKDIRAKASIDFTKTGRDRTVKYYPGSYGPPDPVTGATGVYTVPAFATGATPSASNYNFGIVMYRLSDQYLLYAEALNKTGDTFNALKYLNFIRVRAGLTGYLITDPAVSSMDKLEDVIIQERQWELFAEGKRWFDLIRTDHVIKIMDPIVKRRQIASGIPPAQAIGWGTDVRKYYWPLNRNVLNSNELLVQNPPYSD